MDQLNLSKSYPEIVELTEDELETHDELTSESAPQCNNGMNLSDCTSEDGSTVFASSYSVENDNGENESGEYVPGSFEGPEKTMEVLFHPSKGKPDGLRALNRKQLDYICLKAKCSILSKASNNHIDAYVLSESSMFVYKHRFIMKTCGTTTLLRCLGSLLDFADQLGMELTWVGYSRKNLNNPEAQSWPHSSFSDEIKFLSSHEKLQDRLKGSGHVLGPVTGDHWFVYVANPCLSLEPLMSAQGPSSERTVNLMMFDISEEVGKLFYQTSGLTAKEMTVKAGINTLCPGAVIDECSFTPCGYSMNAILHNSYSTIHITPEPQCSYVSFETNTSLPNYASLVRNVLNAFRPKRFVLTMFSDEAAASSMSELPMDPKIIGVANVGKYVRSAFSSTKVESEICCHMGCYSLESVVASGDFVPLRRERSLTDLHD